MENMDRKPAAKIDPITFAASEKPSPPAAAYNSLTTPLNKMLHALTGSQKPSTPSPVAQGADYVSPFK